MNAVEAALGDVVEGPGLEEEVQGDTAGEPCDLTARHCLLGGRTQPRAKSSKSVDVATHQGDRDPENFWVEVERKGTESHTHRVIRSGPRR